MSYYVNSFNVNNIKNNQSRAAFLVNQTDLNAIYGKYKYDQAYSDAINKGVVYQSEFNQMENIRSIDNGSMYEVVFTSVLSIMDNIGTKKFQIRSKGTAIRVTPRFPENPTGFLFQELYPGILSNKLKDNGQKKKNILIISGCLAVSGVLLLSIFSSSPAPTPEQQVQEVSLRADVNDALSVRYADNNGEP